jgi:hypothetical protein
LSQYRLEKVINTDEWDRFINSTKHGTIFQYSAYLEALSARYSCFFIYKNKELRAAILLIESNDGTNTILDDFIIYNGIIFGTPTIGQNSSQILSEHFNISEFIANTLPTLYKKIELSLTPKNCDIRPYLWFNYGTNLPQYKASVRYTSFVDISDIASAKTLEDISLYNKASKSRRQVIRYAKREGVITKEEFNLEIFLNLYSSTMSRQELKISKEKIGTIKKILNNLNNHGLIKMYFSYTKNGSIGSAACFAIDHIRAYYLFGASDSNLRDSHTGTAVLWDSFAKLNHYGVNEVDLEGVNSPDRGWFKLSFGGDIVPYYHIIKSE